jgi:hypothetical protein
LCLERALPQEVGRQRPWEFGSERLQLSFVLELDRFESTFRAWGHVPIPRVGLPNEKLLFLGVLAAVAAPT